LLNTTYEDDIASGQGCMDDTEENKTVDIIT